MKRFMPTLLAVAFVSFNLGCAQQAVAPAPRAQQPAHRPLPAQQIAHDNRGMDNNDIKQQ